MDALSIEGFSTPKQLKSALALRRTDIPELVGLLGALQLCPIDVNLTIVHDNVLVARYMEGTAKPDKVVSPIVDACKAVARKKGLAALRFHHQHGHRADRAGRHDYVRFNKRADALATQARKLLSG